MKSNKNYSRLKQHLYLLMLFLPIFSLADDPANVLFQKGNQLYAKAQYRQAAQIYQQILKEGYQSAAVYFNLGNAYYKSDDLPSAILYYEKAHKLAPNDPDINVNIRFANLKIADKIEPQPTFFVTRWWQSFILALPVNTLAVLSTVFILSGFLLLIAYLFANVLILKKAFFYTGILAIGIGIISIFMASRQVNYFDENHEAVVFSNSVVVKSSPDANAKPLFVLHEGTKVAINRQNGNWIEIELSNGNSGWIMTDQVKSI